jgi:hypothetical protein
MRCPIIFLNPPVTNVAVGAALCCFATCLSSNIQNFNRHAIRALMFARQVLSTRDSGDAELLEAASAGM